MRLWSYLREIMMVHPRQTVCEERAEMTYEEMVIFAEAFSKKLSGQKCCAILCGSEMAASMALLACFAAGVTAVPLSARYGEAHCRKILDTVSPTALITDMHGELQVVHLTDSAYRPPRVHPALIMCTSGTTGAPKGAMLTEQNILTNVKDICAYLKIGKSDRVLIARPLYHCAVLTGELLVSLVKGAGIRFFSREFNPKLLLELIEEQGISVFCGTPTQLSMMARFMHKSTSCPLRVISISGECMGAEAGRRIADAFPLADIYHVYGLTEACPRVSYLPPELFRDFPDRVGLPLSSVNLRIMRPDGSQAEENEAGILWVKGDNVMEGYYAAPEQTEKVLQNGWLCTKDIAVIDKNGLLKIQGRSDDLIIRAGMNIYPAEVEATLRLDDRVRDVMVYKIEKPHLGVQIGLKISGSFANADEVRSLCSKVLPSFQIPTVISLLDELPKNGSGKIIRR